MPLVASRSRTCRAHASMCRQSSPLNWQYVINSSSGRSNNETATTAARSVSVAVSRSSLIVGVPSQKCRRASLASRSNSIWQKQPVHVTASGPRRFIAQPPRRAPPPRIAYSNSASVGNRVPAHWQYATASCQVTCTTGYLTGRANTLGKLAVGHRRLVEIKQRQSNQVRRPLVGVPTTVLAHHELATGQPHHTGAARLLGRGRRRLGPSCKRRQHDGSGQRGDDVVTATTHFTHCDAPGGVGDSVGAGNRRRHRPRLNRQITTCPALNRAEWAAGFALVVLPPFPQNAAAVPAMETQPDHPNDAQLVQRLKQRDKSALDELLQRYGGKMYGVAMQFMRNEHDAQEVMQDALLNVWRKIDSFESRSAFSSWLYRVTANAALMTLRKHRKHQADISMDAVPTDAPGAPLGLKQETETPGDALARHEFGEQVLAAVNRLEQPYRTAVLLRDVEEFSITEIAELTGASEAAVKSRIHRGRLALRKLLLPYLEAEPRQPT
jgi:RNA polymerase sigma-70 factor (ECF subfamily)